MSTNNGAPPLKKHRILIIEPFCGGSHLQLVNLLTESLMKYECQNILLHKYTLPAKKWHWRARTSALYFSQIVDKFEDYRVLFCSSVLNLAELTALRPDLSQLKKVLYFHENQLVYPVRKSQDRDFQYGYNQILSSLVADIVVFNSTFNMESFLSNISTFLKLIPDQRPKGIAGEIRQKCTVLYFPIMYKNIKMELSIKQVECGTQETVCFPILYGNTVRKSDASTSQETKKICLKPASDICCLKDVKHDCNCSDHINSAIMTIESKTDMPVPSRKITAGTFNTKVDICENRVQLSAHTPFDSESNASHILQETTSLCTHICDIKTESHKNLPIPTNISSLHTSDKTHSSSFDAKCDRLECPHDRKIITMSPLHIVWPHRWEHDKDPDTFFKALIQLSEEGYNFHVSVLGETFTDVPEIFEESKKILYDHIKHWGYLPSKSDYFRTLEKADIVVSTAKHEFFGVAMLEAIYCGCYPLCPKRLVYPEILQHDEYMYNTDNQLLKKLRQFCKLPHLVRTKEIKIDLERFSWDVLMPKYMDILEIKTKD